MLFMAISINNNASLFTARFLNNSQNNLQTAQERLSSGKRINRAADDAAGLAIAARLTTQLLGSQQSYRNAYDGISFTQTAGASISELQNITQRIRELSVQSANGTLGDTERQFLQQEVSGLQEEAQSIITSAEFSGNQFLATDGSIDIQTGENSSSTISIQTTDLLAKLSNDGFFSVDISTANGVQTALGALDASTDSLVQQRADFGAAANRLESAGRSLEVEAESLAASRSRIEDADYAAEMASRTSSLILQNAGLASQAQGYVSSRLATMLLK